jgi:mannose-6-phosphate isomerase-like protein (cupin superfamily)/2'-5' RNA ligase
MLIRRLKDCEEFIAGDGSILRELFHPDKTDMAIRYSLAHAQVRPGEKTRPHRLKTAEVYYLLQGRGRMHIDGAVCEVSPHGAVYIPPHSVQYIENTGSNALVFLCIVDPAWRREDEEVVEGDMGRLAIDVVLLPDEAMTDRAIAINRQLGPEMVLSREDRLPHISLAMGCIDETKVETIRQRLESLAQETTLRQLRVVGIISPVHSRGETTSLLEVERTPQLQELHEEVMKEMRPFLGCAATEAMIADEVVAPSTLDWIRTYAEKSSHEHFRPHITLGYGQVPPGPSLPISFAVTRLALCHLGNHCTCRRILAAVTL